MTIEELIDELKQFPYDSEVVVYMKQIDKYSSIETIRQTNDEDIFVVDSDNIIIEC